ncbi:tripartite tricarboxylate transporter substrate-binding protein, partial [Tropicimonas sp.]|uniref:tripartite tricarboxylate transporter substrate-binding protein n=1 Tax=Tropicimonas sp. TaxID=2067044 RepID=UPI003A85076E
EAKGFVESGDIKVIALLAPERLGGEFADLPTASEQGINAIGANWRGFYAPGGMSDEAYDFWVKAIHDLYESDAWKSVMEVNGLAPLDLAGPDFQAFVNESVSRIEGLSREIGIVK